MRGKRNGDLFDLPYLGISPQPTAADVHGERREKSIRLFSRTSHKYLRKPWKIPSYDPVSIPGPHQTLRDGSKEISWHLQEPGGFTKLLPALSRQGSQMPAMQCKWYSSCLNADHNRYKASCLLEWPWSVRLPAPWAHRALDNNIEVGGLKPWSFWGDSLVCPMQDVWPKTFFLIFSLCI